MADKKFRMNTGSKVTPSTGCTLYPKGGITTSKYRFTDSSTIWEVSSPYKLKGRADSTIYTSMDKALSSCNGNTRCKGFTEHDGKFILNSEVTLYQAPGHQAYLKGSLCEVSRNTLWEMLPPKLILNTKLTNKNYKSFDDAAALCVPNPACVGISLMGNDFYMMSTTKYHNNRNAASWVKRGTNSYSFFLLHFVHFYQSH